MRFSCSISSKVSRSMSSLQILPKVQSKSGIMWTEFTTIRTTLISKKSSNSLQHELLWGGTIQCGVLSRSKLRLRYRRAYFATASNIYLSIVHSMLNHLNLFLQLQPAKEFRYRRDKQSGPKMKTKSFLNTSSTTPRSIAGSLLFRNFSKPRLTINSQNTHISSNAIRKKSTWLRHRSKLNKHYSHATNSADILTTFLIRIIT